MNISQGFCTDLTTCKTNLTLSQCTPPVKWIPPPCPDDCTGHGRCINRTAPDWVAEEAKAHNPFWTGNESYCLCHGKYLGINCGQYPPSDNTVALAAGISSAVIAGIIVGLAIGLAGLGGGSAFAYAQLGGDNEERVVENNPIYSDPNKAGNNPLHKE